MAQKGKTNANINMYESWIIVIKYVGVAWAWGKSLEIKY
jgi:hypothetical protein